MAELKIPYTLWVNLVSTEELKVPEGAQMKMVLTSKYLKVESDCNAIQKLDETNYANRRIFWQLALQRGKINYIGIEEYKVDFDQTPAKTTFVLVVDEWDIWIFEEDKLHDAVEFKELIEKWNAGN